ncbi:MAG: hypothetical protein GTN69_08660 [Armatimonadetes bacterium]|nr:hypothetical protein [Armatimonadota bacterium]NIO75935.1 hypothetical protein [Armatimonadota bacterium]NIO98747.1 hypothetical protein [Armatimonadota bacterium]
MKRGLYYGIACISLVMVSVLLFTAGCGEKGTSGGGDSVDRARLPDFAPENPSPEFLRAASVLKPMAAEPSGGGGDLERAAMAGRLNRVMPAAWELFGTLSDEQIEKMIDTNEVSIPATQLTDKQWDALNHFFDVWHQTYKGVSPLEDWSEDVVVDLYKLGAREDLSNIVIAFKAGRSKRVAILFHVRQSDGSLSPPLPLGIGDL